MSSADVSRFATNQSAISNVTISRSVNIFQYNSRPLIASYALAVMTTTLVFALGIYSLRANGVGHSSSFSGIFCATRNPYLDQLAKGHSLATQPLDKSLAREKLQFGVLADADHESGISSHIAFGKPSQIIKLKRKGNKT